MTRVRWVSACVAASLLALPAQAAAQGLLPLQPPAADDMMSPYPLGPLQTFGNGTPASAARPTRPALASLTRPLQALAARDGQSQAARRLNPASESRQAAIRPSARPHEWQRGTIGSESVLSLAPRTQERAASRQLCFPSSTIHLSQNERDACNGGAAPVKGRFEELLGE